MSKVFDLSYTDESRSRFDLEAEESAPLSFYQHGVSAIMPIHEPGLPFLQALTAVLKQSVLRELLIVVQKCPKELLNSLETMSQNSVIKLLKPKKPLSKLQAYQFAAKKAQGQYLMFIDQHAVLSPYATKRMLMAMLSLKNKDWVVSPSRQHPVPQPLFSHLLDPKDSVKALLGLKTQAWTGGVSSHALYAHVPCADENCLLIPRVFFWEIEGFDVQCRGASAIMDLSLKVHLKGGGVFSMPQVRTRQLASKPVSERKEYVGYLNYYRKHYTKSTTCNWLLPLSILLGLRALARSLRAFFKRKKMRKKREPSLTELLAKENIA